MLTKFVFDGKEKRYIVFRGEEQCGYLKKIDEEWVLYDDACYMYSEQEQVELISWYKEILKKTMELNRNYV